MQGIVEQITFDTEIKIYGNIFRAKAKSLYVTEKMPNDCYAKIFFHDHFVLVVSLAEDFAYFGKDLGSIGISPPFEDSIFYGGRLYRKKEEDYQIVKKHCFGSPIDTEGEVSFWDYESEKDDFLLSIAINSRTKKRSDVVANVILPKEIMLI